MKKFRTPAWLATSFSAALSSAVKAATPAGASPILGAVTWMQDTLLGEVASSVAVIAVAVVGFMMLSGRLNWRYGATVIVGCFVLFGAATIVGGIPHGGGLSAMADLTLGIPVFRALTQPQMFAGVTYSFFIINGVVTTEVFLIARSFWIFGVALAVHGVGYLACLREPRIFDLWLTRVSRCPRNRTWRRHRCNSYQP